MASQNLTIEFAEPLRGKNAKSFWAGVGIIALAVWLAWNGWFTAVADRLGYQVAADDGYGIVPGGEIIIDTVCLIGVAGIAVFKLCWRLLLAMAERFGFVASGVLSWAAKENGQPAADRVTEALRSHERRLRELEAELFDDPFFDDDEGKGEDGIDIAERMHLEASIGLSKAKAEIEELRRVIRRMEQERADLAAAQERAKADAAPAPATPEA